ncbi:MAG: DUF262 domain-containing protein [Marinilabiliaceae bacterium]|nr:DUF262 domain-containing protein [Marinilabiliaceae bacterium]
MSNPNDNFHTRTVSSLENCNFFIDEYQRGYKWTAQQVLDLLNDINNFDKNKEAFYCLQPLAVKELCDETKKEHFETEALNGYEVIDGQQRLTTIYLILKVLNHEHYHIKYQTREKSAVFLKTINEKVGDLAVPYDDRDKRYDQVIKSLNKSILEQWKASFHKKEFDNIDNYHFFSAYLSIKAWFSNKSADFKRTFLNKLLNDTHFIWYLDDREEDAKKVFRNLNSGKIGLTNAELIKALFINNLQNANKEIQELHQNTFANEWDQIEQTLQDDDFWFFINNSTDSNKYQTRIDFLFDIVTQKPAQEKDKLYTYRFYDEDPQKLDWRLVKSHYLKLREWYNNRLWYHLIGYMIDREFTTIQHLVKLSGMNNNGKGISKTQFEQELYGLIRKKFTSSNKRRAISHNIDDITFEEDYQEVKNILLLFNIEQYQRNVTGFRFPFKAFKHTPWTIEHIHAQNADDIEIINELKVWIKDVSFIKDEIEKKIEDLNKVAKALEKQKEISDKEAKYLLNIKDQLSTLEEKIKTYNKEIEPSLLKLSDGLDKLQDSELISGDQRQILNELKPYTKEFLDVHKLGNLALLDGPTNSGLGKRTFAKKRDYILSVDSQPWETKDTDEDVIKRPYIPPATVQVFLKYYTKEVEKLNSWGYQDRSNYLEVIRETLKPYFEEKEEWNA